MRELVSVVDYYSNKKHVLESWVIKNNIVIKKHVVMNVVCVGEKEYCKRVCARVLGRVLSGKCAQACDQHPACAFLRRNHVIGLF
jgi:hypothetical protein